MSPSAWANFRALLRRSMRRFEDERAEDRSAFRFVLEIEEDEDDGGYIAYLPAAPGIVSQGDTIPEVIENFGDAFAEVMVAKLNREDQQRNQSGPMAPLKLAL